MRRSTPMARVLEMIRNRDLPPDLPQHDPMPQAQRSWEEMRDYAARCRGALQQADEMIRALQADNDAKDREIAALRQSVGDLTRDNRVVRSYADNIRTRLTSIREQMERAESEALQFARTSLQVQPETPEERADAAVGAEIIARAAGTTTLASTLPKNEWPRSAQG